MSMYVLVVIFARDVDLAVIDERFARDASLRVVGQDRVEHGIRDLVRDLVGMPLGNRFDW